LPFALPFGAAAAFAGAAAALGAAFEPDAFGAAAAGFFAAAMVNAPSLSLSTHLSKARFVLLQQLHGCTFHSLLMNLRQQRKKIPLFGF
jgi:hypothetical protein